MFKKTLDGFTFVAPSRRYQKKYDVFDSNNKYITSFGDNSYMQYYDRIGYYSGFDHLDPKRRNAYRQRHKNDNLTEPSAGYFSYYYLW